MYTFGSIVNGWFDDSTRSVKVESEFAISPIFRQNVIDLLKDRIINKGYFKDHELPAVLPQ